MITEIDNWKNYSNGPLCAKGYASLHNTIQSGYPLIRTNPKGSADPGWKRISWEMAYNIIVEKLNEIHSPMRISG